MRDISNEIKKKNDFPAGGKGTRLHVLLEERTHNRIYTLIISFNVSHRNQNRERPILLQRESLSVDPKMKDLVLRNMK